MKISNEIKARIYAQYLPYFIGTPASLALCSIIEKHITAALDNRKIERYRIELKPLSAITDEHKEYCYHRNSEYCKYDETQTYCSYLKAANHLIEKEGIKSMYFLSSQSDYLRTHGYALPYMEYSVDQLVKAGIYKLQK